MNSLTKSPEKARDEEEKKQKTSITIIFRYADWFDKAILFLCALLGAIGDGMSTNVLLVFVSRLFNSLGYGRGAQTKPENFMHEIEQKQPLQKSSIAFLKIRRSFKKSLVKRSLGMALPELNHFTEASIAASRIFQRIDRKPEIDEAGSTVALVGASGSGKSDLLSALIQEVYDADCGTIRCLCDGYQETTIDATMDEVIAAATAANAHSFIRQLPEGYETKVVAHKLATIQNADTIAVMSEGSVIEQGSHADLVNINTGHYARLVKLQRQFSSFNEHENNTPLAARSSASRLSTAKSSPAIFDSPATFNDPQSLSSSNHIPPSFSRLISLNSPHIMETSIIGKSLHRRHIGSVHNHFNPTL
ncbi:putative ABC transporter B family member 8 [Tanacetum coccineum]